MRNINKYLFIHKLDLLLLVTVSKQYYSQNNISLIVINNKSLVITNDMLFWLYVYKYIINVRKWNWIFTSSICLYIISIIFENIIKKPNINLVLNNNKSLILVNNKDLNSWLIYIYDILTYYKKYNNFYFNLTIFKYVVTSISWKLIFSDDYFNFWFNFLHDFIINNSLWWYVALSTYAIYRVIHNKVYKKYYKKTSNKYYKNYNYHRDTIKNFIKNRNYIRNFIKTCKKNFNNYVEPYKRLRDYNPWYSHPIKDAYNRDVDHFYYLREKKFITYNIKKKKFIKYFYNTYITNLNKNINDLNTKNFETFLQTSDLERYHDFILESYNTEFNAQILYDYYIKPTLELPFTNDDIPFTFFNFKSGIDKEILNNYSYLVSYAYIFEKKKKSELSKKDLQNSFFNFYKSQLKENNALNLNYFDNLIIPRDHSKMRKTEFNQIFQDIESYNLNDLKIIINKCFDDLIKSDEILSINSSYEEHLAFDHMDYSKSQNNLSLLLFINKNNINDSKLNKFISKIKLNYAEVSSCLDTLDLLDTNFTTNSEMLELFSNENFFYLDYLSLTLNKVSYSLCYLIFLFKVLKTIKEYNEYYNQRSSDFTSIYNDTVFKYHKHVDTKFKNLTESLNSFMQYKAELASLDFKFDDSLSCFHFNKTNKAKYFTSLNNSLNKINNIKQNKILNNNNYENFFHYFSQYYDYKNFEKISISNGPEILSFDSYVYPNIVLEDLQEHLKFKKQNLKQWLNYYHYDNNEALKNFDDLKFYLYDLPGYENFKEDIYLFFNYKDSDLLKINLDDDNIYEKIEFQYNYGVLYFNYLIKCCKSRKILVHNCLIENILFDDNEFYYQTSDYFKDEDRHLFLNYLNNFIKGVKFTHRSKTQNLVDFINSEIYVYARFIEKLKNFNFEILYDSSILNKLSDKNLYDLEADLSSLVGIIDHQLLKLGSLRKMYAKSIRLLDLKTLNDFIEHPFFNKIKGLLLFKDVYFNVLEELVYEERLMDHLYNISMCLFRVFEKHLTYLRRDVLLHNNLMPKISGLSEDDWIYIFKNIEIKNPLIFIELYNSKSLYLYKDVWKPSLTFKQIIYSLSDFSERHMLDPTSSDYLIWKDFISQYKKRNTIIYDLKKKHIRLLHEYFNIYNKNTYDNYSNEELFKLVLLNNNLHYANDACYVITKNVKNEVDTFDYNSLLVTNTTSSNLEKNEDVNFLKFEDIQLPDATNINLYNFIDFDSTLDNTNERIEISKDFLFDINDKITNLTNSQFKNYLLNEVILLDNLYDSYLFSDYKDIKYLQQSCDRIFYLFMFYNNMLEFNKLNINSALLQELVSSTCNKKFNYLSLDKFKYILNLTNQNLFQWNSYLAELFNSKNFHIENVLYTLILNVYNTFNINNDNNVKYLSKLNNNVLESCFKRIKSINIYTFKTDIAYNALQSIYKFLDVHILKVIVMLNQFIAYKNLLQDFYLDLCESTKNNLDVLQKVLLKLNKLDKNNNNYVSLINILLYVKDPIYLYNILNVNLKLYLEYILNIYSIIKTPDYSEVNYNIILNHIFYNETKVYSSQERDSLNIIKFSNFFSVSKLNKLNDLINELDYSTNYFNLTLFDVNELELNKDLILNNLNINNLNIFDNFKIDNLFKNFKLLFTVNDISLIKFYNLTEISLFDSSDLNNVKNECDIIKLFNSRISLNKLFILNKKKNNIKRLKRESAPATNRNNRVEETYDNDTNNINEDLNDTEAEALNLKYQKKAEKKKYFVSNLLSGYRQWASDLEYIKEYQNCKIIFNDTLLNLDHPMWDDLRPQFKNYKHFLYFVKTISDEHKEALFNNLWSLAIENIQAQRQLKIEQRQDQKWYNLLTQSIKDKSNIIDEFKLNLRDKEALINWHNNYWFVHANNKRKKKKYIKLMVEDAWTRILEEDIPNQDYIPTFNRAGKLNSENLAGLFYDNLKTSNLTGLPSEFKKPKKENKLKQLYLDWWKKV